MGVAVSMMSMIDSARQVENPYITAVRKGGKQSVFIGPESDKPESRSIRAATTKDRTMDDIFKEFYGGEYGTLAKEMSVKCKKFGSSPAMLYRPIEKVCKEKNEAGKDWEYTYLGATKQVSYVDMWNNFVSIGYALKDQLGLQAGAKIGLYEETRWEWMTTCYGAWTQQMVGVTVYANLGDDALLYAIKESEMDAIFVSGKQVAKLIKLCKEAGIPTPPLLVVDPIPEGTDVQDVKVFLFDEVLKQNLNKPTPELSSDPNSTALIMYTSGTTGDPKGVVMSHGNVYAAALGLAKRMAIILGEPKIGVPLSEANMHIAYLPQAHILEFTAENVMLLRGAVLGFGNPRTLTDTSARPHGDLTEFKPTFLCGVPRIFDTIKKTVESRLPAPGTLQRRIFDRAFEERKAALAKGYDTPYFNGRVFAKPAALLGGRCRAIVSGGAPMSGDTYEFLTVVFGCAVGQGYGLTETCAATSIQQYYDLQRENIGSVLDCVEVKFRDVEMWKHTDPEPRGEVLVRGPVVTQGYYKQEQKTKEAFLEGGWFATGDVGQMQPDGTFKIIGRTKALAKNAHGEYIALEALESTYVLNPLALPNGICILVKSDEAFVTALVLTDEAKAMKFAREKGIEGTWPAILSTPAFIKAGIASFQETAKQQKRKPFEFLKNIKFLNEEWTPENGIMTAAMKLKRREIDSKYEEVIKQLFDSVPK